MKIAIISDTHDNVVNFKKIVDWIDKEGIKTIIHCGDICLPDTLKEALKDFSGEFKGVFGNADNLYQFSKQDYQNPPKVVVKKEIGEIKEEKIVFTHFPKIAKALAKSQEYKIVFYGHTHKPWEEKIGKCTMANPGNVAGILYKPSFAVYDTKKEKLELKILETL